ncbi:MAG TPA: P1 family peptidase [Gemmatimonadales bacterium]|nr:P1 family peptidase [Gemmatimonadales bacterium]
MRACLMALLFVPSIVGAQARPRARALGIAPGIFATGRWNAITDVAGVRVGQVTVDAGDSIHTGVTAIIPEDSNTFAYRLPAAIYVGNGFGKLLGVTQVQELGEIESPILLTCTLCVWRVADALTGWMLARPGMEQVRSFNPVVGETNDGGLSAIRLRPVRPDHVVQALESAASGPVAEGSVGAGRGTINFGWKGGIGTSSRKLPDRLGGWTVGVLVQTNYGGDLTVMGVPVGRIWGHQPFPEPRGPGGSVMVVVATDAPLLERNLGRLAKRATFGLARTGSWMDNGSGDYVIAFSTAAELRRKYDATRVGGPEVANEQMSALFAAVIEATEEAVYNALLAATPVRNAQGRVADSLPGDRLQALLREHHAIP